MALLGSQLAVSLRAQASEHTLASVFEEAVAWGKTAKSVKKRQWSKSRDELMDSLVGATVSFTAQVNTRDITRSGGTASYEAALPIGPSYTDDLAEWELEELAPIWTEVTVAETVAFRFTTIAYLVIQLADNSGRLGSTRTFHGTGELTSVSVADSQVTISIDVTGEL
jgi:hypothetical protein